MMSQFYYINCLTPDPLVRAVDFCSVVMKFKKWDSFNNVDSIAVRGNSGLLVGSILSYKFKKNLLIVRKKESSHSGLRYEGEIKNNFIIVDDFMCDGETVCTILDNIYSVDRNLNCKGILLYNSGSFNFKECYLYNNKNYLKNELRIPVITIAKSDYPNSYTAPAGFRRYGTLRKYKQTPVTKVRSKKNSSK